jgi:hypothetical protein
MRTLSRIATMAVLALAPFGARAQDTSRYQLDIVSPADEAALPSDGGDVQVRTAIVPQLANGDRIELLVDGLPAARPGTALEHDLSGLAPGRHRLQARIIDSTGNVGAVSPSTSFIFGRQADIASQAR